MLAQQQQQQRCSSSVACAFQTLSTGAVTARLPLTQYRPQQLTVFMYACACLQAIDERLQGVLELESQRHAQLTPSGNIIQHVQRGESSSQQLCAAEGVSVQMQQLGLGTCWLLLGAGMSCPGLNGRADLAGRAISG